MFSPSDELTATTKLVEAFTSHRLPVNTDKWISKELYTTFALAPSDVRYSPQLFFRDDLANTLALLERIQWLQQHCPLHQLNYVHEDFRGKHPLSGRLHHHTRLILNVFFLRKKDLLHFRMRWTDLVDSKWSK